MTEIVCTFGRYVPLEPQTIMKIKIKILLPLATALFISTNGGAAPAQGGDIVGEWEMVGSVVDTNDNLQIDESERKNLKETMKDRMKLNGDGTGVFTVAELPGRYEIKDSGNSGRKILTWYDKADGRHRIGTIIKVTKDELHIKEPGGHGLFVWKRL
jgi:hypothetical protein